MPLNRLARMFAAPAGVLVIVPALVIAVGLSVLLLGRRATRDSAESMATRQLAAQASDVQHDIDSALAQSKTVFESLKVLADQALPTPDAVLRMRDVVLGRRGVAFTSIIFPSGSWYVTLDDAGTGDVQVGVGRVDETKKTSERQIFAFKGGEPQLVRTEPPNTYDPRTRERYTAAVAKKSTVSLPPSTMSTIHRMGLTVAEPVYDTDGKLTAVLTIDFDVAKLSGFLARPPLAGSRTVMFTKDKAVLAYPSAEAPKEALDENHVLRFSDFHDPALDALSAVLGDTATLPEQHLLHLSTSDGNYLASITAVGGKQSGISEWYLATLVPESTLFAATWRFGRETIIASIAAVLIALGVAVMFAWNLVRMRRAVGEAQKEAKSAAARAKELGSYRLVAKLGGGGMGEVWRAQHQLLARVAAIKLVRPDALRDPRFAPIVQERFRREAQTLASLRSRHTIELWDYGTTEDGSFFYVMELLDGVDLAQLVMKHGPQPAARVISIIAQACQSLAEAHDAGLLHRDIKPANLYLCRAADEVDIVKLLDFGIVHNMADPVEEPIGPPAERLSQPALSTGERLTAIGSVIGTPGYIAPEQATGASLDARGDLYALGCVAWWLLTGSEVFPRQTEDEVMLAHVSDPVPDLRSKVPGWLPPELEQLVLRCLEKKPAARPSDARALAETLFDIDIPAEEAWTRAKAVAWWAKLETTANSPTLPSDAETAVGDRVLVPHRAATEQHPSQNAKTIQARPPTRS